MLFNSLDFAIFLPIVFILYWFVFNKNIKIQNLLIVVTSYVFYGWWDWRFLSLILFSTLVDYLVGLGLSKQENRTKRKLLFLTSIFVNIGLLMFFKYYNFFMDSFTNAFSFFGEPISTDRLNIVLPVGISFYTFQTLSYSIDVYKRKLKPTNDFIAFAAFVSFFPQLVAGPIERAKNLLPQFWIKREFNYTVAADGMRQILWGFFKKMVIADNLAVYINSVYSNYSSYNGSTLFIVACLFSVQIYSDFSGYSDIAIGTARLFGFNLMKNFAFPFFSRDIAEFWRRWHISLTTWFRDYIYYPLGGSRCSKFKNIRNVFIIYIISGFWHGANWTYVNWGIVNALFFIPLLLLSRNRKNLNNIETNTLLPSIKDTYYMLKTFSIVSLGFVFFRSATSTDAIKYLFLIFSKSFLAKPFIYPIKYLFFPLISLFIVEWIMRHREHGLNFTNENKITKRAVEVFVILLIFIYANYDANQFIYFQF